MERFISWLVITVLGLISLGACAPASEVIGRETENGVDSPGTHSEPEADPPFNFDPLLPFDAIPPIYAPIFQPAEEIPYSDEELVIGVAIKGEAKAYSITVLRSREMVNDELAGIPILVTW